MHMNVIQIARKALWAGCLLLGRWYFKSQLLAVLLTFGDNYLHEGGNGTTNTSVQASCRDRGGHSFLFVSLPLLHSCANLGWCVNPQNLCREGRGQCCWEGHFRTLLSRRLTLTLSLFHTHTNSLTLTLTLSRTLSLSHTHSADAGGAEDNAAGRDILAPSSRGGSP